VEWQAYRLSGQDALAVRSRKKLRNEELLVPALAGTRLRMELDRVPLWRGDNVSIKQLAEDFGRYLYLPRLKNSHVLAAAVEDGLGLLLWRQESFAYADSYDQTAGRYRGLRCGKQIAVSLDNLDGLLVKPEAALKQQAAEAEPAPGLMLGGVISEGLTFGPVTLLGCATGGTGPPPGPRPPKRFHGTVALDPTRVGRDAG